jgi:hypothetical protein
MLGDLTSKLQHLTLRHEQEPTIQDLTPDILKNVLGRKNGALLRCVCKGLKHSIESLPDLVLLMSPEGTNHATPGFFSQFQSGVTVGSRYSWGFSDRWLYSLLDAAQAGLQVESVSPLHVTSQTIGPLSERLEKLQSGRANSTSGPSRIRRLSLAYSSSFRSFADFRNVFLSFRTAVDFLDISLELEYFSTYDHTLAGMVALLDSSVSLKELTIRLFFNFRLPLPKVTGGPEYARAS